MRNIKKLLFILPFTLASLCYGVGFHEREVEIYLKDGSVHRYVTRMGADGDRIVKNNFGHKQSDIVRKDITTRHGTTSKRFSSSS